MGRAKGSGLPREVRFWPKVERRGWSECWPWTAATVHTPSGFLYGKFFWELDGDRRVYVLAHRAAFYFVHGRWPEPRGLHGCDFALCCNAENPGHVHEGTQADNMREMVERGRDRHGTSGPPRKLSDDQVLAIVERYKAGGVSQAALAVEYDVSSATINAVVRRKGRYF